MSMKQTAVMRRVTDRFNSCYGLLTFAGFSCLITIKLMSKTLIFLCGNEIVQLIFHTRCRGGTMFGFGMPELIIIMVIVLVVFGAGKLPEIGGALGKSIRNFKKASEGKDEIEIKPKSEDSDKKA